MPFGIELLFDPQMDKSIRAIWRKLDKEKIPTPLHRDNPHVTLSAFDDANMKVVEVRCRTVAAKFPPLTACFESIGSFTNERVLFLAPVVTPELLDIHEKVHRAIGPLVKGHSHYYLPGYCWAPHCTLTMAKSDRNYLKGFKVMRDIPIGWKGYFTRLEAHEYELLKGGFFKRLRTVFSATLRRKQR